MYILGEFSSVAQLTYREAVTRKTLLPPSHLPNGTGRKSFSNLTFWLFHIKRTRRHLPTSAIETKVASPL